MGTRCIWLVFLGMVAELGISVACGGQDPTGTVPLSTVAPTVTSPNPTVQVTPTVIPSPTIIPTVPPIPVSSPTIPFTPAPTPLPQTVGLILDVTTPSEDTVVTAEFVTVAGLTSPDATVSVNGILALPDSQGRFSVDLALFLADNPLPIEIIATSIAGEHQSLVRTVILVR